MPPSAVSIANMRCRSIRTKVNVCECCDLHSSVVNVSPLLRSDVVSLDKWLPPFRNNIAFIFRDSRSMKNARED